MAATFLILTIIIACGIFIYKWRTSPYRRMPKGTKPLPGPRGLPFIGRIHDLPAEMTWLKFHEWGQKYGPIYKMEIFNETHIWISDEEVTRELMARKGGIYNDRPTITNLPDNKYSGTYLPLLGRNEIWTRQRKFAHQILPSALTVPTKQPKAFYATQERSLLLHRLLLNPATYIDSIEGFTARASSRWAWGTSAHADDLAKATMALLLAISPAGALPNVVPYLGNLPVWASPWKKEEAKRRVAEQKFYREAFYAAKARYESGKAENRDVLRECYSKTYFQSKDAEGTGVEKRKAAAESDKEAMDCISMMAIASALTIGSPCQTFILAMLEYPEWQTKLQEEIERVCGDRVPEWTDRPNMPLTRAVVKEICRWRAPVPTGIPHSLEQDDVYKDYFLPAGSVIHAFEHGFNRSPKLYPSPHLFNPDRWLNPSYPTYKEPLSIYPNLKGYSQFGHGRRTCQGVEIVEEELFLVMSGIAWAFNIVPKNAPELSTNSAGNAVLAAAMPECQVCADRQVTGGRGGRLGKKDLDYSSLLIAKPLDFSDEFDLRVRGKERGKRIVESAVEAMKEEVGVVFDALGFRGEDSGENVMVREKDEVGGPKSIEVKSETVETKVEGWKEKMEKRMSVEITPIVFDRKRKTSDTESLVLLNETWGKN